MTICDSCADTFRRFSDLAQVQVRAQAQGQKVAAVLVLARKAGRSVSLIRFSCCSANDLNHHSKARNQEVDQCQDRVVAAAVGQDGREAARVDQEVAVRVVVDQNLVVEAPRNAPEVGQVRIYYAMRKW